MSVPELQSNGTAAGEGERGAVPAGPIDGSRLRSFIGLSIGLVGPRANLAVSGVLITLFVQERASGALAVTFALTADRLVSWITYPVAGRLSDRTQSRVGRRTPYMAASLIVLGVTTYAFTLVHGYWLLVLLILVAGQAASVFTLTNVAVVPEVFGRSRWIKALLLTTVLGTIASLVIKGTVIASWRQSDPSTFDLPFQVAGGIMVTVGIVVLLLVREAKTATYGAEVDRKERARPARSELREILSGPNAKVLVGGSLLFWSGIGSTAYVAILYFQRVLHAGASAQTVAGLATGLPVFIIGIALGVPLSRKLSPMQLAIGAPLLGGVLAGVQYFDTHLWQAVVLSYIGAPFIGAYIIVMAPLLLQLLPRSGGLGERLGVLLAPFNLCSVILAYVAAAVVDATGNYKLVWLFPAATGLGHATVNCWLKYPERRAASPDMVKRLWEWSVVQAESMAETGIVAGLLAAPLMGVVTEEDADSAVVIDMARNILGNPYEDDPPSALPDPGDAGGVTGVRHVGGGPLEERAMGDQKSGRGVDESSGSAPGTSAGTQPASLADGPGRNGGSGVGWSDSTGGPRSPSGPSGPMGGMNTTPDGGVVSIHDANSTGAGTGAGIDAGAGVGAVAAATGTGPTGAGSTGAGAGAAATGSGANGAATDGDDGADRTGRADGSSHEE